MTEKNHEGTITVAVENRTSRIPSMAYLIGGGWVPWPFPRG